VVEDLGRLGELADRGETAADQAEVDARDRQAGDGTRRDRATAGEDGGEDHPPAEGDGHVGGAARQEEGRVALRTGQDGPADSARRLEDVLAGGEGEERRRQPTEQGAGGTGRQSVAQAPVRWMASWRRRL
jgi:hypothetical protein